MSRAFLFLLLFASQCAQAQNVESDRASDWFKRYLIGSFASLDSSFISAPDKRFLLSPAKCSTRNDISCVVASNHSTGLHLDGSRINNQLVKLDWQTTTEYNSKGFVLERRSLTDSLRFDSIAYSIGQGTSLVKTKYSYTDKNNLAVASYYRVREVDLDGSFIYSNTVMIWGVAPKLTVLVVPNPGTSGNIGFYIAGTSAPSAEITILNGAGAMIVHEKKSGLTGSTYISLAPYHLKRGYYVLDVVTDHERSSQRFIVL